MSRHASRIWLIPTGYVAVSVVCAFALPRIEHAYLGSYTFNLSISSTQAYLSAAASGMMALTAIVFSVAFVMVQFSAVAYSPRLVLFFVRDRILFHTLGVFVATFVYSLWTLAWVDRAGSGTVPLFSTTLVVVMVVVSMALFSVLVQRITDLQIGNVLRLIGDRGRDVIREMFPRLDETQDAEQANRSVISSRTLLGPVTQTLKYSGKPRTIGKYDIAALVRQAREAGAVIEMVCAVGDTLVEDSVILRVHGGKAEIAEASLLRSVKLETERTFEQDPKYPIRLLVDIGIKALSPAINDPTTAVQTIDQIEDLLRRLGRRELDTGYAADAEGNLRLVFPTPFWDDYLALAFDEIRQYGAGSVQVMRRLRSALTGLADSLTSPARIEAVQKYLERLDAMIERSSLEADDRLAARQEDRQGLGLSRTRAEGSRVDAR
jgi:uncharacterized membrane protein